MILDRLSVDLQVVIRTAEQEDLPALEWFGMFAEHRELIRHAYWRQQQGEVVMLVASVNGFPTGQAWVDLAKHPHTAIGLVWAVRVIPVLQRIGLGTALMSGAESVLRSRGCATAEVGVERTNPGARRFYEGMGYTAIGTVREAYEYTTPWGAYRRVPVDEWILRKPLVPDEGWAPAGA